MTLHTDICFYGPTSSHLTTGFGKAMSQEEILQYCLRTDNGKEIGSFSGCLCENSSMLFGADHFSNEHLAIMGKLRYPVAYLRSLRVPETQNRRQGYGSELLRLFKTMAIEKGARSSFARISDPETTREELTEFYCDKNGWQLVEQTDDLESNLVVCEFLVDGKN